MSDAEDKLLQEMDVKRWCKGFLNMWKSQHGIIYGQTADKFEAVIAVIDRLREENERLRKELDRLNTLIRENMIPGRDW